VIKEEDAAKFLYHFNVNMAKPLATSQSGSEEGKDATFVSAVAATDLPYVMDSFARRIIQTAICEQIMTRDTDVVIAEKAGIIEAARTKVTAALSEMGISVLYMGYAGPLDWDGRIQTSIDDVYIAGKRSLAANQLAPALPIMERQARVELMLGLAEAAKNGKLPALPSIIGGVPSELMEPLKQWLGTKKE
jgi:hypothetical protein